MDALDLLSRRASSPKLEAPAPDDDALHAIIRDALRAPDHGLLRPWRILSIRGDARERFGALLASALEAREPEVEPADLDRAKRKPLRAPLVLVVAAAPVASSKVPEIEQVLSAGALAHGILLGLHARGYAGIWRTGPAAYDPRVKAGLGLREADHIVAFLYAGTRAAPTPELVRPDVADHLTAWSGEPS